MDGAAGPGHPNMQASREKQETRFTDYTDHRQYISSVKVCVICESREKYSAFLGES